MDRTPQHMASACARAGAGGAVPSSITHTYVYGKINIQDGTFFATRNAFRLELLKKSNEKQRSYLQTYSAAGVARFSCVHGHDACVAAETRRFASVIKQSCEAEA